jgi:chemotaxis protein MotB
MDAIEPVSVARPRRRKSRRHAEHPNHERWLVSYADFITLLFAFFTTMYAISTVDAKKLNSMAASVQVAFEPNTAAGTTVPPRVEPVAVGVPKVSGPSDQLGLVDLETRLTARLAKATSENRVEIENDHRGLVVSIRESGSFAPGSTDLSGPAQALLNDLGAALVEVGNKVLIEGHTDDVPIRTARFASNWELSTARATAVIAYLLDHFAIRPERLSAAGYAEYHPRVPNGSAENRARNRRVDIVILRPSPRAPASAPSTKTP